MASKTTLFLLHYHSQTLLHSLAMAEGTADSSVHQCEGVANRLGGMGEVPDIRPTPTCRP